MGFANFFSQPGTSGSGRKAKGRKSATGSGKERDAESGLDYPVEAPGTFGFGARYDSSTVGRFLTPDWSAAPEAVPYANLADPQSLNLYAYVMNNPVTEVDAFGHCGKGATGPNACPAPAPSKTKMASRMAQQQIGPDYEQNGGSKTVGDIAARINHETTGPFISQSKYVYIMTYGP